MREPYNPAEPLRFDATDEEIHARHRVLTKREYSRWSRDEFVVRIAREMTESLKDNIRAATKRPVDAPRPTDTEGR